MQNVDEPIGAPKMPNEPENRPPLQLKLGFGFDDLYEREGLERIDAAFMDFLSTGDPAIFDRLTQARRNPDNLSALDHSSLIIETARFLEPFVAKLFGIDDDLAGMSAEHLAYNRVFECRRQFVQRRALKKYKLSDVEDFDGAAAAATLRGFMRDDIGEDSFADHVMKWMESPEGFEDALDVAEKYAAWATLSDEGRRSRKQSVLFKQPQKTDPENLVTTEIHARGGLDVHMRGKESHRRREGFDLTDSGMSLRQALGEAHYCIWCHNQGKDSCSTGLREKSGTGYRANAFGTPLTGCPLGEKISEMNILKSGGFAIAALAVVTTDNPLCAATGHRICNDCMKSCIYQRQEPVDIPQIETRTLKDVLALPWGFEIYSLLTRWTPLDFRRPVPRKNSGYKVLVVGLGPAGFNLAHHLLNDGHTVVAIDGLKIEPLEATLSGVQIDGQRVPFEPVQNAAALREPLGTRVVAGFGGVAEYGITSRWDKNNLKLIRLLLERREGFSLFGGVRFGGTLTIEDAMSLGFDHIALCMGAGRPTFIDIPNALAKGVRMASDFLMALQLTGAAKQESLANLYIRLPVAVIGGGLTAIDAATEARAYYPFQVEKFLRRYESLVAIKGDAVVRNSWSADEKLIADEFIAHARAIRAERMAAAEAGRSPEISELLDAWGGVTVIYRRRLVDAPAYTGNHEEVALALDEGIGFAECLTPLGMEIDADGYVQTLRLAQRRVDADGALGETVKEISMPAKSVLLAAGTQPNTVLKREVPEELPELNGKYFQAFDIHGEPAEPEGSAKPDSLDVFMKHREDGRAMSFWGDLHPSFAGNVVKAMGGTKQGYPLITEKMSRHKPTDILGRDLIARLNDDLRPRVERVERLTPTIVEVVLYAPRQARNFQPGQFFRLQNFETLATKVEGTVLAMEGLALTGAWVDQEKGLISTIVLEVGGSSNLCQFLRPGEPVVLMGPTGEPTDTPGGETVLLMGGGLGNAVLLSIGRAFRNVGSKVLYFAGYKKLEDRYRVSSIENAADVVVWCSDEAPGFTPTRPQDFSFVGNIVDAITKYSEGSLGVPSIPVSDVDRIICIGSDRMMAAVATARRGVLSGHLKTEHIAIGSINSPMQCMMKEICGQCLQVHVDPKTGGRKIIFSCFNQDQDLDHVDFKCLNTRLNINSCQEKLTAHWIDQVLGASVDDDGKIRP